MSKSRKNLAFSQNLSIYSSITIKEVNIMDLKARRSLFEKAFAFQDDEQYDKAIEELNKVLHIDPNFVEAHYLMGNVYNLMGNTDKAVLSYEKVLRIDPMHSKAKYMLDLLVDEGKGTPEILEDRKKCENAEVYFCNGVESFNTKNYEKAIEAFRKAIEISPEHHQAYYNLGVIYYYTGDMKRAQDFWKKALDYDPKNPKVFLNLGILAYKNGKIEEAVSFWEKVAVDKIPLAQVYCNLGVVYSERGETKKAKEYLSKALDCNPNYELVKDNLKQIM
ncbi:MAG: tetratricopeptide repeat protein [bacterium]|nr:tetratricopeptide repeat protein [bacterium]